MLSSTPRPKKPCTDAGRDLISTVVRKRDADHFCVVSMTATGGLLWRLRVGNVERRPLTATWCDVRNVEHNGNSRKDTSSVRGEHVRKTTVAAELTT